MQTFIRLVAIAKRNNAFLYWNNSFGWWVIKYENLEHRGLELIHKF